MSDYLGKDIPKLGFGLMRLPSLEEGGHDVAQVEKMVDMFLDAGFTYFDTARGYGESEATIKKALVDRHPRDSYYLATKLAPWIGDNDRESARKMFETSCETAGVDYFDFYLLHNLGGPRTAVFDKLGLWDFVAELKESGRIKHVGMSYHGTATELAPILRRHHDELEFIQLQINWADWEDSYTQSHKCYNLARKYDLPVVIMEPIKGGLLANPPQDVADVFAEADPASTPADWALRFAAHLDGVITVLSGMSTLEQMEQNIKTFSPEKPFGREEFDVCMKAAEKLTETDLIPCTGCEYCTKDCPSNIPVAGIMSVTNRYRMYDLPKGKSVGEDSGRPRAAATNSQGQYNWQTSQGSKASACIRCRTCEDACPQHLPIVDLLKEAVEIFENTPEAEKVRIQVDKD